MIICTHPTETINENGNRVCQTCGKILIGKDGMETENES